MWGTDVLISIHANAYSLGEWNNSNGIETYVYTRLSEASLRIAEVVQRKLVTAMGLRNRGVLRSNLYMVRGTRMPAALAECGYMTNRAEVTLLLSEEYRMRCVGVIVDALAEVYDLKSKPVAAPADPVAVIVIIDGKCIDDGILRDGRAYVSARTVGDALGMSVEWCAATKTAALTSKK